MFRFTWTRIPSTREQFLQEPEATVMRYAATAEKFAQVLANDPSVDSVTIEHPEGTQFFVRQDDGIWA